MGRFKKLVELEEAIEKFIADYRIPSMWVCDTVKKGNGILWGEGEVVIPIITFLEGGMRFLCAQWWGTTLGIFD